MLDDAIRSALASHGHLAVDAMTLGDSDNLYTAGLRSHAAINVMMAIEDQLDVQFPDHLLKRSTFETIAAIRGAIESVLAA